MRDRNAPAPMLDAPIPGQGLTAPLGDRPWQQPAAIATPEKALTYYVERMTEERQVDQMLDLLELGIPVDTLVDTVQLTGVMEGVHSVDVGVIIAPALTELVSQIATKAGVKHKVEGEDIDPDVPTRSSLALTLKDIKEQPKGMVTKEPTVEEPEEMPEEKPTGLMARK